MSFVDISCPATRDLPVFVACAVGERNWAEAAGFRRRFRVVVRTDGEEKPAFVIRRQLHVHLRGDDRWDDRRDDRWDDIWRRGTSLCDSPLAPRSPEMGILDDLG